MKNQCARALTILIVPVLLLPALGCNGVIGDAAIGSGPAGPAGPGGPGGSGGPGPAPGTPEEVGENGGMLCDGTPRVGSTPIRRLSNVEYDNTIRDLLGDDSAPAQGFPLDEGSAAITQVTATHLLNYMQSAETLAQRAWDDRRGRLFGCDPADIGAEACAREFISSFGARAYRRPMSADEIESFVVLHQSGEDFGDGVRRVTEAMLISAHFLYRIELSTPGVGEVIVELDDYELASRLSYLLWRTMPDEELTAMAAAGELGTPEAIENQARRMLDDPRARDSLQDIIGRWMGVSEIGTLSKSEALFPDFDDDTRDSMGVEATAFIDWVMWDQNGSLDTFLTAPVGFVDTHLAGVYGVEAPASGMMERRDLDPAERAGVLTLSSTLAIHATSTLTSPVLRGKLVREQFLCDRVPDPPPGIEIRPPEYEPGTPARERWSAHSEDPVCAGCHTLMDPIGFGFEAYDAIGAFRTHDEGWVVDDTGEVTEGGTMDGQFSGARELAERLAGDDSVRACVSRQFFRMVFGRIEGDDDACSVQTVYETFAESGWDMRELLVGLARADAFRYRRIQSPEGEVTP